QTLILFIFLLLPLLPRLSLSATTAPIPNHHRRTRSYPLGPQNPTRLLLLRCLPPAPAQQDPRPEAPPDLDHPRLGSQGHRLLRVLRRPEEARALIQWVEIALHRARVGQEVAALKRVGVSDSVGIDLVPCLYNFRRHHCLLINLLESCPNRELNKPINAFVN
ncbi:hypothetical protein PHJA_002546400, partial [Phtheirospermum japonicum]